MATTKKQARAKAPTDDQRHVTARDSLTVTDTPTIEVETVRVSQPLMNERAAARYLNRSVFFLQSSRVGRGRTGPPFYRINRSIFYTQRDLDEWLAARRVVVTSKTSRKKKAG